MSRSSSPRTKLVWPTTFIFCAMVGTAYAQQVALDSQEQSTVDWIKANEAVSQFKRGHADIVKWEQTNVPADKPLEVKAGTQLFSSAETAVKEAWRLRPELTASLFQLGERNRDSIAQGNWLAVDPKLRRRISDFDAILDVASDVRKAWYSAWAAHSLVAKLHDIQDASDTSAELARRMTRVGNWSRMEQAQWQSKLGRIKIQVAKAELDVRQADTVLLRATKLWGQVLSVEMPMGMQDIAKQPITSAEVQSRLAKLNEVLIDSEMFKVSKNAQIALQVYLANYKIAQLNQEDTKLQQFINEEVVLRYNGMLLSVWDLLNQATEVSQSQITLITGLRDLLSAEMDLQHVLLGGTPANLGATSTEASTVK